MNSSKAKNDLIEIQAKFELEQAKNRALLCGVDYALWGYNLETGSQEQYKKLKGKWSNTFLDVPDFRNTMRTLGIIHPNDMSVFDAYCDSLERGECNTSFELRMLSDDDGVIWIRYESLQVCNKGGKPWIVVGTTKDITRKKMDDLSFMKRFRTDKLTGLYNQSAAYEVISNKLSMLPKKGNVALIIVDIDNFKAINLEHSAAFGDYIIEAVSQIIKDSGKQNDIIGRIGGDQFIIFSYDFQERADIDRYIERMLSRIRGNVYNRDVYVTASAGIAVLEESMTLAELYRAADLALYDIKHKAKDSYSFFTNEYTGAAFHGKTQIKHNMSSDNSDTDSATPMLNSVLQRVYDFAFDVYSNRSDSADKIQAILGFIGSTFNLHRIFVVQSYHEHDAYIAAEWYNEKSVPLSYEYRENYIANYQRITGYYASNDAFVCNDISTFKYKFLENKNKIGTAKAFVSYGIYDGLRLVGSICFEDCAGPREWTPEEISALMSIKKMVGTYVVNITSQTKVENERYYSRIIQDVNNISSFVINPQTFEVKHIENAAKKTYPKLKLGMKCYEAIVDRDEPCKVCPMLMVSEENPKYTIESYIKKKQKWVSQNATFIKRSNGEQECLMCISDITTFMTSVQSKDKLTGVLTYDGFEVETTKILEETDDEFAIVSFKIFNFRSINDDFGYEIGNDVLKTTAEKLTLSLGKLERIARVSASNFMGLYKYNSRMSWTILNKLDYLFRVVQDEIQKRYPKLTFHYMCGIYPIDRSDYKLSVAIDRANMAMKTLSDGRYLLKNSLVIFDDELNAVIKERKNIERDMYSALRNHEFVIYYQPKVNLITGKIYGAEALVRWVKADGRIISPSVFVPIFEQNEFILEMDLYVYKRVFSQMRKWIDKGIKVPVISINVSRLHLRGDDFPEHLEKIVDAYNIPHNYIEVELTESTFFKNLDHLIGVMNNLRERGFKISVDDFGTGYSTLNLISVLPIDVLKLDGNFFMKNELSDKNRKVIESILSLAKELNLSVVSEGVETKEQVAFLRKHCCDAVQGYYFYKPMDAKSFDHLLEIVDLEE